MRNTHSRDFKSRMKRNKVKQSEGTQVREREQHTQTMPAREGQNDAEETVTIDGSRIINMSKLKQYMNDLTIHAAQRGGAFTLAGETREGLAWHPLYRGNVQCVNLLFPWKPPQK